MKNLILFLTIIMAVLSMTALFAPAPALADDQLVCGKTYMYVYDDVMFLMKFVSSNPELPCTSGNMFLYWMGQKTSYTFSIKSTNIVVISNFVTFVLFYDQLYYMDPGGIVFSEY